MNKKTVKFQTLQQNCAVIVDKKAHSHTSKHNVHVIAILNI